MRTINEIVVHHSAVAQSIPMINLLKSFNNNHKIRLHDRYKQPVSRSEYPHIAYHCIISKDDWRWVRDFDLPGYHASNYRVNLESVGICVNGSFDVDTPNQYQLKELEQRILDLKKNFPTITKVSAHRDYANKVCPGDNMTQDIIDHLDKLVRGETHTIYTSNMKPFMEEPEWAQEALIWAEKNNISNLERLDDKITRREAIVLMHRAAKLMVK